jgi:hypothetical protein
LELIHLLEHQHVSIVLQEHMQVLQALPHARHVWQALIPLQALPHAPLAVLEHILVQGLGLAYHV